MGLAAGMVSLVLAGCPGADWEFNDPSDAAPPIDASVADAASSGSSSSHNGFDGSSNKPNDAGFHSDAAPGGCVNAKICGCMSGADCSNSNSVCDPNSHQCVDCTENNDCGNGICIANTCVRRCDSSSPCARGFTCGPPASGSGDPFCQECAVFSQGLDCSSNPKQPLCNPTTLHCVGCVTASDCFPPAQGVPMGCSVSGVCYVNLPNGGSQSTNHDP
jgi:hypothetical protein